jgi:hypothetical protein
MGQTVIFFARFIEHKFAHQIKNARSQLQQGFTAGGIGLEEVACTNFEPPMSLKGPMADITRNRKGTISDMR